MKTTIDGDWREQIVGRYSLRQKNISDMFVVNSFKVDIETDGICVWIYSAFELLTRSPCPTLTFLSCFSPSPSPCTKGNTSDTYSVSACLKFYSGYPISTTRLVHSTSRILGIRKIGAEEERQLLLGLVSEFPPASFARLDIGILKI